MKFGSVCSGIEAASVAWHPLGWRASFVSEIEPFPSAVLAHHYPDTPNWGDMSKFQEWPDAAIDVLVGGTPCQAFSVAGLRKGLADPRGNLTLTYLAIAAKYRPQWLVWENVPGVLSDRTGAFGSLVGGLAELGYGWAYRIFDAQHFGLAQRRRRVFLIGYLGDWRPAAAVLFERESLRGDPPPSRKARQVAPTIPARSTAGGGLGTDWDCDGGVITMAHGQGGAEIGFDRGPTLTCNHEAPIVAHSLRGEGFDASVDGTGQGTPLVPVFTGDGITADPITANEGETYTQEGNTFRLHNCVGSAIAVALQDVRAMGHGASHANGGGQVAVALQDVRAMSKSQNGRGWNDDGTAYTVDTHATQGVAVAFDTTQITSPANYSNPRPGDPCHPLAAGAHAPAVAFQPRIARNGRGDMGEVVNALQAQSGSTGKGDAAPCVATSMQVRRLTPTECERLQGFPDGYTAIPWRGKPADQCPDGPRYKALGNSMAVPVMRWIGERIDAVDRMINVERAEVAA